MSDEQLKRDYDAWHLSLAELEANSGGDRADAIWHRMARRRLGSVNGLRVAEIGCGRGTFSIEMAKAGARMTALDHSEAAVTVGRERAKRAGVEIEWVCADARATGLPDGAFDLVVSFECLEHVPQPERMAAELTRILRPGGRCILTTPSYLNGALIAWLQSWVTGKAINTGSGVQPHESFFLFFLVKRMLQRAGLTVEATDSRLFRFLLLPRVAPEKLQVTEFRSEYLNWVFRPFGLHFLFDMTKPGNS